MQAPQKKKQKIFLPKKRMPRWSRSLPGVKDGEGIPGRNQRISCPFSSKVRALRTSQSIVSSFAVELPPLPG